MTDRLTGWWPQSIASLVVITKQEMETFVGTSPQARGSSGPLDVKQAPANPQASGAGADFVQAAEQYFADVFGCVAWHGMACGVSWHGGMVLCWSGCGWRRLGGGQLFRSLP